MSTSSQLKSWGSKALLSATHPCKKSHKITELWASFEVLHRFAASSKLNDRVEESEGLNPHDFNLSTQLSLSFPDLKSDHCCHHLSISQAGER